MTHQADKWIITNWVGKHVKQVSSCDGPTAREIGRTGLVVDGFFDEKGACHVKTNEGWYCPTSRLEMVS